MTLTLVNGLFWAPRIHRAAILKTWWYRFGPHYNFYGWIDRNNGNSIIQSHAVGPSKAGPL